MAGFEPATPRPPGVYATRLRYIPYFFQDNFFKLISKKCFIILDLCNISLSNFILFSKFVFKFTIDLEFIYLYVTF